MSILVVAEHDNHSLASAMANTMSAAKIMAAKTQQAIIAVVAGYECSAVADEVAAIAGIDSVLLADCPALAHQLPEVLAPLLVNLVTSKAATHLLAASTTQGKNLLPRVAALLDVAPISDISDIVDGDTFVRPIYAGNALQTVHSSDAVKVVTIRTSSFEADTLSDGSASIETLAAVDSATIVRFIREELSESDRPELGSARIIVSGGRGMGSGDNFVLLESLADTLGAAVGASRAAVDAGFVANDRQVGQTGKIVAPDLYIAVGISGAIQHLAGMKESKIIVAINSDEDAPIFSVADYGLVADLFDAVPELQAQLAS